MSPWRWLESHPVMVLLASMVLAVGLRLPFLAAPMRPDEGGYLMVAQQWGDGGTSLYGNQWVDRPPFLILVFKASEILGSSAVSLHLTSLLFGLLLVLAAWWAGRSINGARGAVVGAVVAAAVGSAYLLEGNDLDGEGIASAFVMLSCAVLLHARFVEGRRRARLTLAFGAGVAAGLAFLTKQNFVDAVVFAGLLLGLDPRRGWRLVVAGTAGLAAPLAATVGWAESPSGPGLAALWNAIFTFREQATRLIASSDGSAAVGRFEGVVVVAVTSGVVLLGWQILVAIRRADALLSLRVALAGMLGYDAFSMVYGENWWHHYLLQLTPVLAMGAALATRRAEMRIRVHLATVVTALSAVLVAVLLVPAAVADRFPGHDRVVLADWLRSAARPGDSIVVFHGLPNIVEMTGLPTPYRYSWTLPMQGFDPRLRLLARTLAGPDAPTWLVRVIGFNSWHDQTPRFDQIRDEEYREVAVVCGDGIWLRDGVFRVLPPLPRCRVGASASSSADGRA